MPLTIWCLGAPDDAGQFLPPQPSSCQRDGSTCCSKTTVATVAQRKSVSLVRIDMEIMQLLLDVRSKKQLSKMFPIFKAEIERKPGIKRGYSA